MSYPNYSRRSRRSVLPKINLALTALVMLLVLVTIVRQSDIETKLVRVEEKTGDAERRVTITADAAAASLTREPWHVFVYDPLGTRGMMPYTAALGQFTMSHRRFTLTTHRLYGLDRPRPLDYRLLRPVRKGGGQSARLAVRATADDLGLQSPLPVKCILQGHVGRVEALNESVFLEPGADITLISEPVKLNADRDNVEVTVQCAEAPAALTRSLTFDVDVDYSDQRYSDVRNAPLLVPAPDPGELQHTTLQRHLAL